MDLNYAAWVLDRMRLWVIYIDTMIVLHICQKKSLTMKVFNKKIPHQVGLFFIIFSTWCTQLSPVVVNNFVDPVPVFTVRGSNISLVPKKVEEQAPLFSLNISPYTQIIKSCYNDQSTETNNLGDRVGPWGMGAMAFGLVANPNANPNSFTAVYGDVATFPSFWAQTKDKYSTLLTINYPQRQDLYYSVDFEYEKVGIRSEIACEPAEGIVVSIQGGICDHKASKPVFYNPATPGTAYLETSQAQNSDPTTYNFMTTIYRELYLSELGMDDYGYQNVELDDITLQIAAYAPIFGTSDTMRLVPRATLGIIIPSDEILKKVTSTTTKDNILKGLVPLGNDGFTGFMVEGAASLDFKNTVNMTFAAGYTIFKERSIKGMRVPNNQYQCILYPFKQDVTKKRGGTWHLSASMFAQDFIEGMKCYIDYTWVVHRRDTVTLDVAANLPIFKDGLPVLERLSEFRVGTGHLGLVYNMTKNVQAGAAVQVVLHGFQVFKPYTFMGSLSITF